MPKRNKSTYGQRAVERKKNILITVEQIKKWPIWPPVVSKAEPRLDVRLKLG
jgi:hypothetical protein